MAQTKTHKRSTIAAIQRDIKRQLRNQANKQARALGNISTARQKQGANHYGK